MIVVKNINQSYSRHGHKKILKDISLTVQEHTITALIGANGAGKSTLLSVMANLLPALSGTVLLDGVDISKIKQVMQQKKSHF